jgi:Mg-chelatase subunit ChlD
MGAGIDVARQELLGERRDAAAGQHIILITDGVFKDDPTAAATAARDAGIEIHALLYPTYEYEPAHVDLMAAIAGANDRVILDPDGGRMADLVLSLTRFRSEPGLFEAITIRDAVPANMRYVEGSARPAAEWDPASRTLEWRLGASAAADRLSLRYRLEPLEPGTWPTNVFAVADYTDVRKSTGRLVFPVPQVDVYALRSAIFLPLAVRHTCVPKAQPLDVVLVLDTSSSMSEPAPGGGTKLEAANRAAATFIDLLRVELDRVGVVGFNDVVQRASGLTADRGQAREALTRLEVRVGTAIDLGLDESAAVLAESPRTGSSPVVVLLSDGVQTRPGDPVASARRLKDRGVAVYAIGLGSAIDLPLLTTIASSPDHLLLAPSVEDLARVFAELSVRIECNRE